MKLTQIIYVNEKRFVCQLVEKVCKQNEIACYTVEQIDNFSYIIDDLVPQLVVVELDTFTNFEDIILLSINESKNKPQLVKIDKLDPNTFIDQIKSFI
jgi:hypothetical protein